MRVAAEDYIRPLKQFWISNHLWFQRNPNSLSLKAKQNLKILNTRSSNGPFFLKRLWSLSNLDQFFSINFRPYLSHFLGTNSFFSRKFTLNFYCSGLSSDSTHISIPFFLYLSIFYLFAEKNVENSKKK